MFYRKEHIADICSDVQKALQQRSNIGPRSVAREAETSHYRFRESRAAITEASDGESDCEDWRTYWANNRALREDGTTAKLFQIPFVVPLTA
jgi:hypothetical protein